MSLTAKLVPKSVASLWITDKGTVPVAIRVHPVNNPSKSRIRVWRGFNFIVYVPSFCGVVACIFSCIRFCLVWWWFGF